ncbi:hypothetical protein FGSG_08487 [Fusarium graminearum PH-1]|uniref:hypothetical protein n=1 Tax=Gibberella zeae (strain ATCC MYA-4620 / CBS 123657 / FGSC 9075 / NRRL 31084 / PH-1) TaxID=229533 RepID=UPI00021F23A7|nr:hypothetical protein FGSG_08487 [Fusarium graminearum PH-1]ESU14851.1 hypothetical protein FGSG_08487 [Fusarium graminearum PH-1]EYB27819.1 hypothetical protein FG05_08487 [Fusarium graminearum]|eukprot:XP_011320276.1 hypothetical protein FGSG_08487 [Fusarium graminearum PH-1]
MSFGGGFGGFGQTNNNNAQPSGFGGFGATNNTTTPGGFGATNTAGGFGAKPAFGSTTGTTGGGLFGSAATNTTATTGTGFGGFGNTANNTATTSAFGGNTGGGMFGGNTANKTGFGAAATTGGSLFGGGGTTTTNPSTGFGSGFGTANNNTIGGAAGDPPGTAITPFQAHTEKEPSSTATNSYQNVLFQDPYQKWSAEELRLTDYVQGRRHGNATGGGAFGVSSGFGGGFGANTNTTTTSGFGANTTANTGGGLFGSNTANNTTTPSTGFGSTGFGAAANNNTATGGGLFGNTANKPAGGLFGGNTAQTNTTGGGLFGGGGNTGTTGGFGATNTTGTGFGQTNTNTAGGGLFGNTQNKPAGTGFSFGNTNTNTTTSGFGAAAGTTNSAFGTNNATQSTGGGLFGGQNNTQAAGTGGGLFGQNNNQAQQTTGSGLFGGQNNQAQQQSGGLFGNKPAASSGGLFGGGATAQTNTGGSLFGNTQQQTNTGGFGAAANNTASGGLFGNKPAAPSGGLFGGGATAQTNTGGTGMFGGLGSNNQAQQNTGTGLFGSANNQQQKPGMFGSSTNNTGGGGLFGGQNNQSAGNSLFGGSTNQQQQQQNGASILGNSQSANAPQGLTANLNDVSAFGSPGLFAGLGGNEVQNPGPLATPLSGGSKPRRSSILPMYKLAPASASRYATPQKRGFGFSYSAYGTPSGSPASSISSTPGNLGHSLLGSSRSGNLSKSLSSNNLRRSFNTEDSILAPGAFSNGAQPRCTPVRGALPAASDVDSPANDETPRQSRATNASPGSKTPEMEEVKGNELAIVHEEDVIVTPEASSISSPDNTPGQYWISPPMEDLEKLNRMQRQKVDQFTVGRDNVGYVSFKVPVDISNIDLADICGTLIVLEPRSATVYPVSAKKPPVGKGLNVPAKIALEQSWPRGGRDKRVASDPKRFNKHVERLKRIENTTFESYDKDTGVWVFSVEHFTTYGLDDDDSDDEDMAEGEAVPTQEMAFDNSINSVDSLTATNSFDFQSHRGLPGGFDEQPQVLETQMSGQQSFLGVSSADSAPNDVRLSLEDEYADDMGDEYDVSEDEDMARSSLEQHLAAELDDNSSEGVPEAVKATPGGILRARMRAVKDSAGPMQLEVADGDDWMEMLRKTVSPVKRDRQLLREMNESPSRKTGVLIDLDKSGADTMRKSSIWRKSTAKQDRLDNLAASTIGMDKGRGFATSIDLMNSLFEKPKPASQNMLASMSGKGFPKWPYQRQDKTMSLDGYEKAFHDAGRPTWGPDEMLVVPRPLGSDGGRRSLTQHADILSFQRSTVQTEKQELRLATFATEHSKRYLGNQDKLTDIRIVDDVPFAVLNAAHLEDVFHHQDMNDPASMQEKHVWELASILFDPLDQSTQSEHLLRRTKLSHFWSHLVDSASSTTIGLARSSDEKAVACLAGHRIVDACKHLLDGKNFRLATLVPLIGTSDAVKKDMREQLKAWHESKMLSEFSEPIRTIYELLSGNACVCEGMKGVPVEDRLDSFVISKKFGLDWKQSFGLRLWYSIGQDDDLAAAVTGFKNDIDQEREYLPLPWYIDQGVKPLWDDVDAESRQDLLWGLLQMYASDASDLEAVLRPENSQLSPLDMRLTWQLGLALSSSGKVSFGQDGAEKADAATVAFASQLTSAGEWLEAVFVLLHLSKPLARKMAIQEHLARHAGLIGDENSTAFSILTEKFLIPSLWIWEALALYMRSVKKDAYLEVQCLLRAASFVEAHRVLVKEVAPLAIVERDYANLSALISQFEGRQELISDWSLGGEIYSFFLALIQHRAKHEIPPQHILEKLLAGLHAMDKEAGEAGVLRYAAVSDMADETAKEIIKASKKKQDTELRSRILNLPLTQDRLLAYSVDLSMERYREVMSH